MTFQLNFASFCLLLTLLLFFFDVHAQNESQTALQAHNNVRAKHQNTPSMTTDSAVQQRAQKCADWNAANGQMSHKCPHKNGEGENLFAGSTPSSKSDAMNRAVQSWYAEKKYYNYNNPGYSDATGHFTQVVWAASNRLGCGVAQKGRDYYVSCLYLPRGNVNTKEQFQKNVLREK